MKKITKTILPVLIIICLLIQISTAGENEYGIVKAWCNNQPATVEHLELKINESVEIKVEVISKVNGFINLKIKEPGVTNAFSVISGPSEIGEWIIEEDVESNWSKVYSWTIAPNGKWTSGNAPINILVWFNKAINDDLSIQFTIVNPIILDEQYSGSIPSHATIDPSSTNQSPSNGSPGFGILTVLLGTTLAVIWKQRNI